MRKFSKLSVKYFGSCFLFVHIFSNVSVKCLNVFQINLTKDWFSWLLFYNFTVILFSLFVEGGYATAGWLNGCRILAELSFYFLTIFSAQQDGGKREIVDCKERSENWESDIQWHVRAKSSAARVKRSWKERKLCFGSEDKKIGLAKPHWLREWSASIFFFILMYMSLARNSWVTQEKGYQSLIWVDGRYPGTAFMRNSFLPLLLLTRINEWAQPVGIDLETSEVEDEHFGYCAKMPTVVVILMVSRFFVEA